MYRAAEAAAQGALFVCSHCHCPHGFPQHATPGWRCIPVDSSTAGPGAMRMYGKVQTQQRTRGPAAHRYTHLEGLTHISQCRSQALLGRCSQASKRRRSARQRVAVTIVRCVPTPVAGTALSPPRVRRAIRGVGKGHARQRRRRHTTTPTPGSNGLHSGRRVVGARTV